MFADASRISSDPSSIASTTKSASSALANARPPFDYIALGYQRNPTKSKRESQRGDEASRAFHNAWSNRRAAARRSFTIVLIATISSDSKKTADHVQSEESQSIDALAAGR
jgi:hypothetical protein